MTKACEVIAPSSDQSVVADVEQWLQQHSLLGTNQFEWYDSALKAVWPHIYTTDPYAAIFLAINVYLECALKRGFEVNADFLKQAKLDDYI